MQQHTRSTRRTLRIPWSAAIIAGTAAAVLAATTHPAHRPADLNDQLAQVAEDMTALAGALEAYRNDWGVLPRSYRVAGETHSDTLRLLTTPTPYLPSVPVDPFSGAENPANRAYGYWGPDMILGGVTVAGPDGPFHIPNMRNESMRNLWFSTHWPEVSDGTQLLPAEVYLLHSLGPDGTQSIMIGPDGVAAYGTLPMTPYDPTNGAESYGDIVRIVITEPQETAISDWWSF